MSKLLVLFRKEEEPWNTFLRRVRDAEGEVVIVLSAFDASFLQEEERNSFLEEISKLRYRARIATKDKLILSIARKQGIRVINSTRILKRELLGHPSREDALRLFSPHLWRQLWRTKLQGMGLLSLPKLRVLALVIVSAVLFLFVVFHLLPSAEVSVTPREDPISQTTNIFLVASGASVQVPKDVKISPLLPITVVADQTVTYKDISKEFIGTSAEVMMTVINRSTEQVKLLKGSRLANQAGMVFRMENGIYVDSGAQVNVKAKAEDIDQYNEIIGERGNVPANLRWDFVALSPELKAQIYAENRKPASGGTTGYRTVLKQQDIDNAKKQLEKQLFASSKELLEAKLSELNLVPGHRYRYLAPTQITKGTFSPIALPTELLGKTVSSITMTGSLAFTKFAYDSQEILDKLSADIAEHVREGKQLLPERLNADQLRVIVIEYDDNLTWVKITANLVGAEQFVLDALTPSGARFSRKMREAVAGLNTKDALRIIKNFPEVERAEISLWPPWTQSLPAVASHISVTIK